MDRLGIDIACVSHNASLDRFEQEQQDFFRRVREAYLRRAEQFPVRIRVIDSARTLPEIRAELGTLIAALS
jgi:dTMP kinase